MKAGSEGIPYLLETCESLLSIDGSHERVVLIACDKNVQKRNCIVLFKFNGEFNNDSCRLDFHRSLASGLSSPRRTARTMSVTSIHNLFHAALLVAGYFI